MAASFIYRSPFPRLGEQEALCPLADLVERKLPPHGYELHAFTPSQMNYRGQKGIVTQLR
jgi:hypothetical protein